MKPCWTTRPVWRDGRGSEARDRLRSVRRVDCCSRIRAEDASVGMQVAATATRCFYLQQLLSFSCRACKDLSKPCLPVGLLKSTANACQACVTCIVGTGITGAYACAAKLEEHSRTRSLFQLENCLESISTGFKKCPVSDNPAWPPWLLICRASGLSYFRLAALCTEQDSRCQQDTGRELFLLDASMPGQSLLPRASQLARSVFSVPKRAQSRSRDHCRRLPICKSPVSVKSLVFGRDSLLCATCKVPSQDVNSASAAN